jgi:hypothetical protein
MPFFFLLVDSWLLSAGAAVVALVPAGCAVSDEVGTASEELAPGCASEVEPPGVTVSTVAVFPDAELVPRVAVGWGPKDSVSSPDSPEGVMLGAPV